ncbi:MAG TPA: hypothetical protein VFY87_09595 [Geminicoccaceae bacterium]|nr:hypothetical protein [Geminicoccaceae bacterium]
MSADPRARRPPLRALTTTSPTPPQAGGRWRRRLLFVLLWALAGGSGFGLALYTLGRPPVHESAPQPTPATPPPAPAEERPPVATPPPERSAEPPAPTTAAPPPPPAAVEETPLVRELIGDPLVAPEPPATLRPRGGPDLGLSPAELEPEAAAPAPAPAPQAAVPGQDRIFIHHRASDAASAGLADRLAEALQRQGSGIVVIRSVPFGIGRPSVRYFHAGDRAAAEALVRAARPALSADGYAAPGAPSDFTHYRPAPRPGTLEIWLPGA